MAVGSAIRLVAKVFFFLGVIPLLYVLSLPFLDHGARLLVDGQEQVAAEDALEARYRALAQRYQASLPQQVVDGVTLRQVEGFPETLRFLYFLDREPELFERDGFFASFQAEALSATCKDDAIMAALSVSGKVRHLFIHLDGEGGHSFSIVASDCPAA